MDAIRDILGVDKKTLKYYIKAVEERKKRFFFKYMEKVSALPKEISDHIYEYYLSGCIRS